MEPFSWCPEALENSCSVSLIILMYLHPYHFTKIPIKHVPEYKAHIQTRSSTKKIHKNKHCGLSPKLMWNTLNRPDT